MENVRDEEENLKLWSPGLWHLVVLWVVTNFYPEGGVDNQSAGLQDVTTQKTTICVLTAVKTSNLIRKFLNLKIKV